jgi:hypothetical protein
MVMKYDHFKEELCSVFSKVRLFDYFTVHIHKCLISIFTKASHAVPLAQIMNEVAIKCLHASFELLKVIGFGFHSPRARRKINFD